MDWNLHPGLGTGPIKFGMTRIEIAQIIGPPVKFKSLEDDEGREFRGDEDGDYNLILHYKRDIISCIIFPFELNNIQIYEQKIYKSEPKHIVTLLKSRNGGTMTIYNDGDFYYKNICIVLHQFLAEDSSNKGLSLWSRDGFDDIISDMEEHWRGHEE